ncbi:MAG: hypothetical protein M1813_009714 [Trichoglossum hirsutum]|nr:MAG: hypothetical protein M1813_009714 [Trichoglossum hirsutum]
MHASYFCFGLLLLLSSTYAKPLASLDSVDERTANIDIIDARDDTYFPNKVHLYFEVANCTTENYYIWKDYRGGCLSYPGSDGLPVPMYSAYVDIREGLKCDVDFFTNTACTEHLVPKGYYPQSIGGSICQAPLTYVLPQQYKGYTALTVNCTAKAT